MLLRRRIGYECKRFVKRISDLWTYFTFIVNAHFGLDNFFLESRLNEKNSSMAIHEKLEKKKKYFEDVGQNTSHESWMRSFCNVLVC